MITPGIRSVSSARLFAECPEKWRLSYAERLRARREPFALALGTRVHRLLELMYKGMFDPEPIAAYLVEAEAEQLANAQSEGEVRQCQKVMAILHGVARQYPAQYAGDVDRGCANIEAKGYFCGWEYRTDLTMEIDGELWVVDHKTFTPGNEGTFMSTGTIDPQAAVYIAGTGARGIIWNLIGKPQLRQTKKEDHIAFCKRIEASYVDDPGKYFTRLRQPLSQEAARNTALQYLSGMEAMERAARDSAARAIVAGYSGSYPKNTRACDMPWGSCPFLPLCTGLPDAGLLFEKKSETFGV